MHRVSILAAAGAAIVLSGTAAQGKEPQDPNKVVCKYEDDSTSRINRKRTCHTRAEWAQEAEAVRRNVEQGLDSTGRQRELGNTFRNSVSQNSDSRPR